MKTIRSGRGLGDSIYLQSIARHLLEKGESRVRVRSDYPAVFKPLARCDVIPFGRDGVDILAHYASRKGIAHTTQFQDCAINAKVGWPIDLRLDWKMEDAALGESLSADGRPILCVQLPRAPMGRKDGFGHDLLPDCRVIQSVIDQVKDRTLVVQIGAGKPLFKFTGIEIDLANKTTVSQLLDVASVAHGFLGYVSFIVPLAESFSKPGLFVWSASGMRSGQEFIRQITPQKIFQKPTSKYVVDNWTAQRIGEAANALLR